MTQLNKLEVKEFDPAAFIEELRKLSIEDAVRMEPRAIWGKDKQFSGFPGQGQKVIIAVATAIEENPTQFYKIMSAVSNFFIQSTGCDTVKIEGALKRPDDLWKLWRLENNRGDFLGEVIKYLTQKKGTTVSDPTENVALGSTRNALKEVL